MTQDRYLGALLGLAVGDALGTTLEFHPPRSFVPLADMVGGGPFALAPGQWTDDTSLALCLAESLIDRRGFDPVDQMQRYVRWYREGYLSSTGECFDIGSTTVGALRRFEETGEPYAGTADKFRAGNGSLMRLAPVPMFFAARPAKAIEMSGLSSQTTHGAPVCVDCCRYYGGVLAGALRGAAKSALLSPLYTPVGGCWDAHPLDPEVAEVAAGSFLEKQPPEIRGRGYVVDCMEAALWAFATTASFEEGALRAVNLGDDADTTGAVYGQLAGAHYGASRIPRRWLDKLAMRDKIEDYARHLLELAGSG